VTYPVSTDSPSFFGGPFHTCFQFFPFCCWHCFVPEFDRFFDAPPAFAERQHISSQSSGINVALACSLSKGKSVLIILPSTLEHRHSCFSFFAVFSGLQIINCLRCLIFLYHEIFLDPSEKRKLFLFSANGKGVGRLPIYISSRPTIIKMRWNIPLSEKLLYFLKYKIAVYFLHNGYCLDVVSIRRGFVMRTNAPLPVEEPCNILPTYYNWCFHHA